MVFSVVLLPILTLAQPRIKCMRIGDDYDFSADRREVNAEEGGANNAMEVQYGNWGRLPAEVLQHVFSFLDLGELVRIYRSLGLSKYWHANIKQELEILVAKAIKMNGEGYTLRELVPIRRMSPQWNRFFLRLYDNRRPNMWRDAFARYSVLSSIFRDPSFGAFALEGLDFLHAQMTRALPIGNFDELKARFPIFAHRLQENIISGGPAFATTHFLLQHPQKQEKLNYPLFSPEFFKVLDEKARVEFSTFFPWASVTDVTWRLFREHLDRTVYARDTEIIKTGNTPLAVTFTRRIRPEHRSEVRAYVDWYRVYFSDYEPGTDILTSTDSGGEPFVEIDENWFY